MNKALLIVFGLGLTLVTSIAPSNTYVERYNNYRGWRDKLPDSPSPEFINFISNTTPLAQKLRNRWLYKLAQNKEWQKFSENYQSTNDINLQCFAQIALLNQGFKDQALLQAKTLWLSGESSTKVCDMLFNAMLEQAPDKESLLRQRVILAIEKQNIKLAIYLLTQFNPNAIKTLMSIHRKPSMISNLAPNSLREGFYLYGLKRLIAKDINQAVKYYQQAIKGNILSEKSQQSFLTSIALYKAMKNHPDTEYWFTKVKPEYYNENLINWHIRYALKNKKWKEISQLIESVGDKENPGWTYWQARALEAQGINEKARSLYESISGKRHYYGFLASLRLKIKPSFQNELVTHHEDQVEQFQPITEEIKTLYTNNQTAEASRIINDFTSELPIEKQSAIADWVARDLNWHGKSVYLGNKIGLKDQLELRFPLAYKDMIEKNSAEYQVPQALIYAIIRQESSFGGNVVSSAGALGLMQIMPETAKNVAKKERVNYSNQNQLFSISKNIHLGTAYLNHLSKIFNNHPILMAAAYNAGPRQVHRWLKEYPPKEIDIWIETIPWHETRNYLKNIVSFYTVYQYRMHETPDLDNVLKNL